MTQSSQRIITVWRKVDSVLDWDFHVSEDATDAARVVENLKKQGVHQYRSYPLGENIAELSSGY